MGSTTGAGRKAAASPTTAASTTTGLPNIVLHDLRRTAATMLKSLGVPARDAQIILDHANIAVTLGVYSEVFDTEIATALGRVNDALGGETGGGTANGARTALNNPCVGPGLLVGWLGRCGGAGTG